MRRIVKVAALAAAVVLLGAHGATAGSTARLHARLTPRQALRLFLAEPRVSSWLARYPKHSLEYEATLAAPPTWTVKVAANAAGLVAAGAVDDRTGIVLVAWTGPQVSWPMARGARGSFGGRYLNHWPVWLGFALAFLIGLLDWRRPASLRNLDLLVLVSFGASLWFFNEGRIFASVPLAYPPLCYLLARTAYVGARGRSPRAARPIWPVWLLAAVVLFAFGFRIAFDISDSHVIDVGYSGVIGAERIAHGESPYGHMPVTDSLPSCGPTDLTGRVVDRIQTNGRCESADDHGDTYGPVAYEAYLPGYGLYGWGGAGDQKLNAGRFTSILFDFFCLVGMALVGWRFGGMRAAATLAFVWATYPFTQYALNSNTNDMVQAAFLIFGFLFVASPAGRGAFGALASWTKFAPLVAMPLWLTYPELRGPRRPKLVFAASFVVVSLLSFWLLLLEPSPFHAGRVFFDRALRWQVGRSSPFSLWDWRQYHAAGIPDLHAVQILLEVLLVAGALLVPFRPRRKSPLQLAALTAALLIGFELVQTHWFYLYIPWFLPFVAFCLIVPTERREVSVR